MISGALGSPLESHVLDLVSTFGQPPSGVGPVLRMACKEEELRGDRQAGMPGRMIYLSFGDLLQQDRMRAAWHVMNTSLHSKARFTKTMPTGSGSVVDAVHAIDD